MTAATRRRTQSINPDVKSSLVFLSFVWSGIEAAAIYHWARFHDKWTRKNVSATNEHQYSRIPFPILISRLSAIPLLPFVSIGVHSWPIFSIQRICLIEENGQPQREPQERRVQELSATLCAPLRP